MKKNLYKAVAFVSLLLSCNKDNPTEFIEKIGEDHNIELSERTLPDSLGISMIELNISAETNDKGVVYFAVTDAYISEPIGYQIIQGDVPEAISVGYFRVKENNAGNFNDTIPANSTLFVYSVFRDIKNTISPVKVDSITVNDISKPILETEYSFPKIASEVDTTVALQMVFNEEVNVVEQKTIQLLGHNSGLTYMLSSDRFSSDGNIINIDIDDIKFVFDDTILVSVPEGTFTDVSGNLSAAVEWNTEYADSSDYYFHVRHENVEEIMDHFLGENEVTDTYNGYKNEPYNWDLFLGYDSDNTVYIKDYYYSQYNTVKFDLDTGGVIFELQETKLYYDADFAQVFEGDPKDDSDYRIYYTPVLTNGIYNGSYNKENGEFNVSYDVVAMEYDNGNNGILGRVKQEFKKIIE